VSEWMDRQNAKALLGNILANMLETGQM